MFLNRHIPTVLVTAALLVGAFTSGAAKAEERCYGDWSDAAPIVARERLRSVRDVQDMARHELGSDLVRIVLCEANGGGFVYRLVLRRGNGRIGNLIVSAAQSPNH